MTALGLRTTLRKTTPRASKSDVGGLGEVCASSRAPTGRVHGEQFEPFHVVAAFDNLQDPLTEGAHPSDQFPCVAAVGPDTLHPRPRSLEHRLGEHEFGTVTVLDVGRMDDYREY